MFYPFTREFLSDFYEEAIEPYPNGHHIFPKGFCGGDYKLVNLFVRAEGLPDVGFLTKTDPMCVLYVGDECENEYARTEVCWNYLNPWWVRPFTLFVDPANPLLLNFEIYDVNSNSSVLKAQKFLGSAQIDFYNIINEPTKRVRIEIDNGKENDGLIGYLIIAAFDYSPSVIGGNYFRFGLEDFVSNSRTFLKANPFFVIERLHKPSMEYVPVYKSCVHKKCAECEWNNIFLMNQFIYHNEIDSDLRICLYDFFERDTDCLVGSFKTNIVELKVNGNMRFSILDKNGRSIGFFSVAFIKEDKEMVLNDFRFRGIGFSTVFGIDFSNTPYNNIGTTNHYIHFDQGIFSYSNAINDVYDALRLLINGKRIKSIGFNETAFLIGEETNMSIKKLLNEYNTFKCGNVFANRAKLSEAFQMMTCDSKQMWIDHKSLSILIFLTNGIISDIQKFIDLLVDSEDSPIITIVVFMGIERKDLSSYFRLNGGKLTHSNGYTAKRELIGLVTYKEEMSFTTSDLRNRLEPIVSRLSLAYIEYCK